MTTPQIRYVGGPLDGKTIPADGWTDAELREGVYEVVPEWEQRAAYDPDPDGDPLLWRYRGPVTV